jgi:hypothetical protein
MSHERRKNVLFRGKKVEGLLPTRILTMSRTQPFNGQKLLNSTVIFAQAKELIAREDIKLPFRPPGHDEANDMLSISSVGRNCLPVNTRTMSM